MDTGYSKWRKLDNAALAFPLVTGKNDTRVFRFYCQLKEEVNGEILQAALDQTMEKYPLFQAVLRKGLFWFYLERRDIRAVVKPEKKTTVQPALYTGSEVASVSRELPQKPDQFRGLSCTDRRNRSDEFRYRTGSGLLDPGTS